MMRDRIKMPDMDLMVQSERNAAGLYLKYAKQLVEQGDAYYCFCDKERLESLKTTVSESGQRFLFMISIA